MSDIIRPRIVCEDEGLGLTPMPDFDPRSPETKLFASFDLADEDGFLAAQRMQHGETIPIAEVLGQAFLIVRFLIKPAQTIAADTGEVGYYPWCAIETADGKVLTAGSRGVFESLRQFLAFRPQTPWNPPLRVVPAAKKLAGGKRYFVLMYQPLDGEGGRKGGKGAGK